MSNYKIIKDEDKLKGFIDWLPTLLPGEIYYCSLFARKKYCPTIKTDKRQVKRFTASKEFLFEKIQQLECEIGAYRQSHEPIPQEALAMYISLNPRSYEKSAIKGIKRLAELITKPYNGYNPHQELLSSIQTSCGRKIFIGFDFDNHCLYQTRIALEKIINTDCLYILQTKGGFHIIVELSKIEERYRKTWYVKISELGADVRGDMLIPIPGCCQGDYIPTLCEF